MKQIMLMRHHPFRVMCGVNIANVAVVLVSYLVAYPSHSSSAWFRWQQQVLGDTLIPNDD